MKVIRGLAALLTLVAILAGIPAALLVVGAGVLPASFPTPDDLTAALTRPDGGELFIGFLVIVAWAGWAYFAIAIVAEAAALALRKPNLALPGFDWGRSVVGGLVATVAAMIAVGPLAATTASAVPLDTTSINATVATEPGPRHATQSTADRSSTADAGTRSPAGTQVARTPVRDTAEDLEHEVERGDTAWGLAERFYGDGPKYKRILAANPQIGPDGWLDVGDTITIPGARPAKPTPPSSTQQDKADRGSGDKRVTVERGDTLSEIADEELGDAGRWPEIAAKSRSITQPDGERITDPDHIEPGWTVVVPGNTDTVKPPVGKTVDKPTDKPADKPTPRPTKPVVPESKPTVEPTTRPTAKPTQHPSRPVERPTVEPRTVNPTQPTTTGAHVDDAPETSEAGDTDLVPMSTVLGAGAVLCAGIIAAVGRNRQRQLRRRAPGQQIPQPPQAAAAVEREMRAIAGPLKLDHLDRALRTLAHNLATHGRDLPGLRYVVLSRDQMVLHLETATNPAAGDAPAPFTGSTDGSVWTLDRAETHQLLEPSAAAEVPAPYPTLVSVGRDADDQIILLDLENIGALSLEADTEQAHHMLAGLGVELAVSPWVDDILVTLVGSHPELPAAIGTDRARYIDTPTELLASLRTRIAADRHHLINGRHHSAAQARRDEPADWQPEVILFGVDLTDDERDELTALVTMQPRPALAAVTITTEPLTAWSISATSPSAARLDPLDLPIAPQLLRDENYTATLQVLETSQRTDTTPAPWWDHTKPMPASEPDGQDAPPTAQITELRTWHQPDHVDQPSEVEASTATDNSDTGADPAAMANPDHQHTATPPAKPATDTEHTEPGPPPAWPEQSQPDRAHDDRAAESTPAGSETEASTMHTDTRSEVPAAPPVAATVHRLPAPVPSITLFGEPAIHSPAGDIVDVTRIGPLTRMAVYLALFPHSTGAEIDKALFISANTRASAISRLRKWLGQTPQGELYVPKLGRRFALHETVRTDWDHYQDLIVGGVNTAATVALVDALKLADGAPITEPEIDRYDFAHRIREEMVAVVRDTAHELADRALGSGDIDQARWAIQRGYIVDPDDECLARDEIRTERLANNRRRVKEIANRLVSKARKDGTDLEEATTRLLNDVRRALG